MLIKWQPDYSQETEGLSEKMKFYTDSKHDFIVLKNGTCLFFNDMNNYEINVKKVMESAKTLTDFSVDIMSGGDYIVNIRGPIDVYVGKEEFANQREEIEKRLDELKYPGEAFTSKDVKGLEHERILVGLYARAKMLKDAHNPEIAKVVMVKG